MNTFAEAVAKLKDLRSGMAYGVYSNVVYDTTYYALERIIAAGVENFAAAKAAEIAKLTQELEHDTYTGNYAAQHATNVALKTI